MRVNVECPNPRCRKHYLMIDTTSFRCSNCGVEFDIQAAAKNYMERLELEKRSKLRRERFRNASYLIIPFLLGGVLHEIGFIAAVLLVIALAWLIFSKLRGSSSITLPKMLVICLLLFVIGSIAGDSASPPTALCRDMTYSYSAHQSGTCSWHGGVSEWYPPPWWSRL